jgi:hypothetical protein
MTCKSLELVLFLTITKVKADTFCVGTFIDTVTNIKKNRQMID